MKNKFQPTTSSAVGLVMLGTICQMPLMLFLAILGKQQKAIAAGWDTLAAEHTGNLIAGWLTGTIAAIGGICMLAGLVIAVMWRLREDALKKARRAK